MRNATSSAPSPPRLEHEHHPEAIARRLAVQPRSSYLRDWLYGGMDGAVTTLAIAAGAAGGRFSPLVIMVLGLANVFADGFSMAASNFLGTARKRRNTAVCRHGNETIFSSIQRVKPKKSAKSIKPKGFTEMIWNVR